MFAALFLSLVLSLIAVVSLRHHFRNLARLKQQSFASDDRAYLRAQSRRRIVISGLLLIVAGLLAGAYLSGNQQHFEAIGELSELNPPQEPTEADRQFVKWWTVYWMVTLVFLFVMILGAIVDYVAVALYGRSQYRRIANEQQELLDRDLAMYRQAKQNERMKRRP
jgi:UDP-N-acetylmuramyl pentapeptide phosphotransferase/UDP-N-acetylglucosamine-1-phosphate transferase